MQNTATNTQTVSEKNINNIKVVDMVVVHKSSNKDKAIQLIANNQDELSFSDDSVSIYLYEHNEYQLEVSYSPEAVNGDPVLEFSFWLDDNEEEEVLSKRGLNEVFDYMKELYDEKIESINEYREEEYNSIYEAY